MNQENHSLSRDTEMLVKALLLALIEEENLQAMSVLKESLTKPIKKEKALSIVVTQAMTRAEIAHLTVEVEKEGQEVVAIVEEIGQETELEVDQEIVSLVLIKMIGDAASLLRTEIVAPQIAI